ncbi:hypothetical protein SCHPADRAFT_592642 [Schizopora paradoxa]|uniref:Uncharacterized protein n=1 Tax=Schizopora paradoxa TaxID=27342 RepID=A0A0H2RH48_9AGAM|nr:hypothetical protein SCHPADRAFT_592642 [Schizopora paradoxa]
MFPMANAEFSKGHTTLLPNISCCAEESRLYLTSSDHDASSIDSVGYLCSVEVLRLSSRRIWMIQSNPRQIFGKPHARTYMLSQTPAPSRRYRSVPILQLFCIATRLRVSRQLPRLSSHCSDSKTRYISFLYLTRSLSPQSLIWVRTYLRHRNYTDSHRGRP